MRINCGGFELNENDFELDGETLSLKNGGGGSGGVLVVNATSTEEEGGYVLTLDKTWKQIKDKRWGWSYKDALFWRSV